MATKTAEESGEPGFDNESGDLGAIAPKYGTTKDTHFAIVGGAGMDFSAVFVEARDSQLPADVAKQLPKNIGHVYTAKAGFDYQTVDYASLFDRYDSGVSLAEAQNLALVSEAE